MDHESGVTTGGPDAAGPRVLWMIFLAMPLGVALLWAVALTMGGDAGGGSGRGRWDGDAGFWMWMAVALGGFAAASYFRNRAVSTAEETARAGQPGSRAGEIQSWLIIAWAMLEAGALLAGVIVFVGGDARLLWYAAAVYVVGLLLTYPRAEWLGVTPR